jgi:hypothetical protein
MPRRGGGTKSVPPIVDTGARTREARTVAAMECAIVEMAGATSAGEGRARGRHRRLTWAL